MDIKPVPKVAAGGIAGAIAALVLALLAAYGYTLDDETGKALATLITAGIPISIGFAAAWLKTDPAKELLKALKAMEAERVEEDVKTAVQEAANATQD